MAEKVYKIWVGDARPTDALIGTLEKGSGNTIIKGAPRQAQAIGGKCMFANRSIAWGIRLINGERPVKRMVQPSDADYKGEVEFLPWGTTGGSPINVRVKAGYPTIDYDYQVLQLQLPRYNDDVEDAYLELPFGENNIFFDSEKEKAEFLKVTHSNEDSVYKNPNSSGAMFHEIKMFDSSKKAVKEADASFDAMSIVKAANSYEKLKIVRDLVGKKKLVKVDESDETSLYEGLMLMAKQNPNEFMEAINEYKRKISDLFERFKSFNAFDLTKNGTVRAGIEKKEDILTDIPAKGEVMLDYMFQNCFLPDVYHAIDKLIHISQKFK